jgi:maltoporin
VGAIAAGNFDAKGARMKTKQQWAVMAMAIATSAATAAPESPPPIEMSGYMRIGGGVNAEGSRQVCFGLPGADTKWRLGNECDHVIEPTFDARLASSDDLQWHLRVMPSSYNSWSGTRSQTGKLNPRFGQAYTYLSGIKVLGDGKFWVGRRFYNRLQLGINDQFLEINDGEGAGLEDMKVGPGRLSAGVVVSPRESAVDTRLAVPIRYEGLKTLPQGDLAVYLTPSVQKRRSAPAPAGVGDSEPRGLALGLYQTLNWSASSSTLLGLRRDRTGDETNTRFVVQHGGLLPAAATHWDALGEYRLNTKTGVDSRWFGLGGRTDTHVSGPFRVLVEMGVDHVRPDNAPSRQMGKVTLAGAVSQGVEAGSRPTLRVFVTHAVWNEAARLSLSERLQQVYGNDKAGTSYGMQFESWW